MDSFVFVTAFLPSAGVAPSSFGTHRWISERRNRDYSSSGQTQPAGGLVASIQSWRQGSWEPLPSSSGSVLPSNDLSLSTPDLTEWTLPFASTAYCQWRKSFGNMEILSTEPAAYANETTIVCATPQEKYELRMEAATPYTLGVGLSQGGPFEVALDNYHALAKTPRIDRVEPPIVWMDLGRGELLDREATLKVRKVCIHRRGRR